MDQHQIHFEVFARRPGGGPFVLQQATENRDAALRSAEEMLESKQFVAVKVTKETLNRETGEFQTISILNKGAPEKPKGKAPIEDRGPPCVSPADLYNVHARDRISRLLEGWLNRNRATPFELLHRPDLIEKLEASGVELQHAVQKIAIPEAQARGVSVHEVIRNFQDLIQRSIDRVLADNRKGLFPDIKNGSFATVCVRLLSEPERTYLLGAAVVNYTAPAKTWSDKVGMLLDLAEAAPPEGPARGLAFSVLEQSLSEILQSRVGLADLLGADLDHGGALAALARLAAADAVDALARTDTLVGRMVPPLTGSAERLGRWLDDPAFQGVRMALSKRLIQELKSLRRLRPTDARGEIDVLRALAMAMTAASGPLLQLEEVREAFIERSQMLVAADFVGAYLKEDRTAVQEAHDLVWLMENVTGGANKRQAVRWLYTTLTSLRFETEMTSGSETPSARLARLAELYRQASRSGKDAAGVDGVLQTIGEIATRIEAESKLTSLVARASMPIPQKMTMLFKMAMGEMAPPGLAADRAKAEALKLMRLPDARAELPKNPEMLEQVRILMQSMEAAA